MTKKRRVTDVYQDGELNVLQSINAPISLFQTYKELAIAQFGDTSKRQFHFRKALMEYLENHKTEFDEVLSRYRKQRA